MTRTRISIQVCKARSAEIDPERVYSKAVASTSHRRHTAVLSSNCRRCGMLGRTAATRTVVNRAAESHRQREDSGRDPVPTLRQTSRFRFHDDELELDPESTT